jgi:hypothetical protein
MRFSYVTTQQDLLHKKKWEALVGLVGACNMQGIISLFGILLTSPIFASA